VADDGLVTLQSSHDFATTLERLTAALEAKGVRVFAQIDHAAGATSAGLELRPTTLVVFGNPVAGTPLMQAAQTVGIDLPLKALVWQDAQGAVHLTYNDPCLDRARGTAWTAAPSKPSRPWRRGSRRSRGTPPALDDGAGCRRRPRNDSGRYVGRMTARRAARARSSAAGKWRLERNEDVENRSSEPGVHRRGLSPVQLDGAQAQDIAGMEDCTKTAGLDKRTGCFQSNVNFLHQARQQERARCAPAAQCRQQRDRCAQGRAGEPANHRRAAAGGAEGGNR
jgi:uncharacterized protein (DUF302 family)